VVACGSLPNCTVEHGNNEEPFNVSVNVGEPAGTEVAVPTGGFMANKLCEIEAILGVGRFVAGVVMVKDIEFDVPVGVETDTAAVPDFAVSVGKIVAVS
jgi:hypothetical protein